MPDRAQVYRPEFPNDFLVHLQVKLAMSLDEHSVLLNVEAGLWVNGTDGVSSYLH
jgi:hypothetical protein